VRACSNTAEAGRDRVEGAGEHGRLSLPGQLPGGARVGGLQDQSGTGLLGALAGDVAAGAARPLADDHRELGLSVEPAGLVRTEDVAAAERDAAPEPAATYRRRRNRRSPDPTRRAACPPGIIE
jgi:hypothetical protein